MHKANTQHSLTFRFRTVLSYREVEASGYIRDDGKLVTTVRVMLP